MNTRLVFACFAVFSLGLAMVSAATVTARPPNVTGLVTHDGPPPTYPDDALKRHASGAGVFLLRTQIKTGRVTQVIVGLSTGDKSLDLAAAQALLQWRFKPGALTHRTIRSVQLHPALTDEEALIKVPVTFVL